MELSDMKNFPVNAGDMSCGVQSLGWEDPLEKEMATHSSILAWELPWKSLVGCCLWGHTESDTTEATQQQQQQHRQHKHKSLHCV